jgi:hypothetical protein
VLSSARLRWLMLYAGCVCSAESTVSRPSRRPIISVIVAVDLHQAALDVRLRVQRLIAAAAQTAAANQPKHDNTTHHSFDHPASTAVAASACSCHRCCPNVSAAVTAPSVIIITTQQHHHLLARHTAGDLAAEKSTLSAVSACQSVVSPHCLLLTSSIPRTIDGLSFLLQPVVSCHVVSRTCCSEERRSIVIWQQLLAVLVPIVVCLILRSVVCFVLVVCCAAARV